MILFNGEGKQEVTIERVRIVEFLSAHTYLNLTEIQQCSYFTMILQALKIVKGKIMHKGSNPLLTLMVLYSL